MNHPSDSIIAWLEARENHRCADKYLSDLIERGSVYDEDANPVIECQIKAESAYAAMPEDFRHALRMKGIKPTV